MHIQFDTCTISQHQVARDCVCTAAAVAILQLQDGISRRHGISIGKQARKLPRDNDREYVLQGDLVSLVRRLHCTVPDNRVPYTGAHVRQPAELPARSSRSNRPNGFATPCAPRFPHGVVRSSGYAARLRPVQHHAQQPAHAPPQDVLELMRGGDCEAADGQWCTAGCTRARSCSTTLCSVRCHQPPAD
jgi:hypothetical protein